MTPKPSAGDDERRKASWDLASGAQNYSALVAGQVSSAFFSFWALSIISHRLETSGYGRVVAVLAVSQAVAHVTLHWTVLSLYRHGCEEFVETGRLAKAFWTRLFLLAACGGTVAASAPLWFRPLATWFAVPSEALWLVPIHIFNSALAIHVQYALLAAKRPRFQALSTTVSRGLLVLALVACAHRGSFSWQAVALVYAIAPLMEATLGFIKLFPLVIPGIAVDRRLLETMIRFSLPLTAFGLLGYLSTNYLDAFFILKLLSASDLGIYTLAYQLVGTFMQLPSLAGSLMLSLFVTLDLEGRSEQLTQYFRELLPAISLLWSGACIAFAAAGGLVIPVFFDSSYSGSVVLLWPLAAAAALGGPVFLGFGALINARSATSISAYLALASALVNVVLNALLIPRFGLMGCAWATVAAYATATVVAAVLCKRLVSLPLGIYALAVAPAVLAAAVVPFSRPALGVGLGWSSAVLLAMTQRRRVGALLKRLNESFRLRLRPMPATNGAPDA